MAGSGGCVGMVVVMRWLSWVARLRIARLLWESIGLALIPIDVGQNNHKIYTAKLGGKKKLGEEIERRDKS